MRQKDEPPPPITRPVGMAAGRAGQRFGFLRLALC
jgi:hypothetical protein